MKGLDTPILLAILHDSTIAKDLLKGLRGEELATTELNFFELRALVSEGSRAERDNQENALARLRRRVTVLPITAHSVRGANQHLKGKGRHRGYQPLVWGTLAVAGCAEWITTRAFAPPKVNLPFRVRLVN